MTRQNQYYNLMTMLKRDGMIDTNQGQKDYMRDYQEPIQIGTRLWELSNSGYLLSIEGKKGNVWVLSEKGMDWEGERLIIKYSSKPKKTKAEQEIKTENKFLNKLVDHTPPMQPTSLLGWIKYLFC